MTKFSQKILIKSLKPSSSEIKETYIGCCVAPRSNQDNNHPLERSQSYSLLSKEVPL